MPQDQTALEIEAGEQARTTLRAIALTIAALAVGVGIHYRDGEYMFPGGAFYPAIWCIGAALAAMAFAVWPPRSLKLSRRLRSGELAVTILMAAVVVQFLLLIRSPPSGWNTWSDDLRDGTVDNVRKYYIGLTVAAALTLLMFVVRRWFWIFPFLGILVTHLYLGCWLVKSCPAPAIDVWHFQQIGARTLLAGGNPYTARYPNIYANKKADDGGPQHVYGEDMAAGGKVTFGFPYPPMSLYLSAAGYRLGGDYRYAHAAALTLAGLLIAFARPGRWGALAAIVLLFTPRVFFVIGRGWTEPLPIFLLALSLFCACRCPRLLPIALGLFLASKQYLVLAVPLIPLLAAKPNNVRSVIRLLGLSLLVAIAVTLPLALHDPAAFYRSTISAQLEAPFRTDALSWLVWIDDRFHIQLGSWVAFALAVPAVVICALRCPRSPAGFSLGLAAVFLPFIAFNKQAFANYYLFVIAAAVFALGLLPMEQTASGDGGIEESPKIKPPTTA